MALFAEIFAKFNHNHDARGRFASSAGTSPVLPAKTRLIPPIDRPQMPATRFFSRISLKPKKKPAKDSPAASMMKAFWETTHPNPLADDERLFGARIDGVDVWGSATLVDPLYSRGGGDDGTNKVVDVWWLRAITRGGGRVALTHITELADEHGVTLTLHAVPVKASPDGKGGKKLTQKKLNAFYKSFGFVEDTYAYSETGSLTRGRGPNYFTREPRAVAKFNPNHEPAGSSRGGQFAPKPAGAAVGHGDWFGETGFMRRPIPDRAGMMEDELADLRALAPDQISEDLASVRRTMLQRGKPVLILDGTPFYHVLDFVPTVKSYNWKTKQFTSIDIKGDEKHVSVDSDELIALLDKNSGIVIVPANSVQVRNDSMVLHRPKWIESATLVTYRDTEDADAEMVASDAAMHDISGGDQSSAAVMIRARAWNEMEHHPLFAGGEHSNWSEKVWNDLKQKIAIDPYNRWHDTYEEAVARGEDRSNPMDATRGYTLFDMLTEAVKDYEGSSSPINDSLRGVRTRGSDLTLEQRVRGKHDAKTMLSAFSDHAEFLETRAPVPLFRGLRGDLAAKLRDAPIGTIFRDGGFSSFSMVRDQALNFITSYNEDGEDVAGIVLRIPAGRKVRALPSTRAREQEWIMDPAIGWKKTGVRTHHGVQEFIVEPVDLRRSRRGRIKPYTPTFHDMVGKSYRVLFDTIEEAQRDWDAQYEMLRDSGISKFNPNHEPAGSSRGGQFAARDGGGSAVMEHAQIPDNTAMREAALNPESSWSKGWEAAADRVANDTGMDTTAEEIRAAMHEALTDLMPTLKTWKRITAEDFLTLLDGDITFHNQYLTGESEGMYDPVARQLAENALFGYKMRPGTYPVSLNSWEGPRLGVLTEDEALARPIYGYLTDDPMGHWYSRNMSEEASDGYDSVSQYGDVAVRFRDEVRDRTTFTVGDSLSKGVSDGRHEIVGRTTLVVKDAPPHIDETQLEYVRHAAQPLDSADKSLAIRMTPWIEGFDPMEWASRGHLDAADRYIRTHSYIEAQYHGRHLTMEDVAEVVIYTGVSEGRRKRLIRRLEDLGIPYTYEGRS